jgi:hypothetical protein
MLPTRMRASSEHIDADGGDQQPAHGRHLSDYIRGEKWLGSEAPRVMVPW